MPSTKEYEVPWWAELFHSFPHIDLSFQIVNSTFRPQDSRYREALSIWAAIPVLWLMVTLLMFLMYFCYRCCQRDTEKKRHAPCLAWSMAILALVTCGALGVGFFGNEETNKGVDWFVSSAEDANSTVGNMHDKVLELRYNINHTLDQGVQGLQNLFQQHPKLNSSLRLNLGVLTRRALAQAHAIMSNIDSINSKAKGVNLDDTISFTKEYGFYRWLGTLLFLCWHILLCLLLLAGIGKSSKCVLLMFSAVGVLTLVLCWTAAGLHLAATVGVSDFCINPDSFVERLGHRYISEDILFYYLRCSDKVYNPFSKELSFSLKAAVDSVTSANTTLTKAIILAEKVIKKAELQPYINKVVSGLDKTVQNIQQLTALVECNNLHKDYVDSLNGICYMALPGVAFILISLAVVGLLLTVMVLMASIAWRHFGKRKGYLEIDADDPFLPRPDNTSPSYYRYGSLPSVRPTSVHEDIPSNTYPLVRKHDQLGSFQSFTRGRTSNPREQMTLQQRRSSPPPAYSTNEFYRQFSDINSTSEDTGPLRPLHPNHVPLANHGGGNSIA